MAFLTKDENGFDFVDHGKGLSMVATVKKIVDFLRVKRAQAATPAQRDKIEKGLKAWENIHKSFALSKNEAELKAAFFLNFTYFLTEYLYAD